MTTERRVCFDFEAKFIDLSHVIESGAVPPKVRRMGTFPVRAHAIIGQRKGAEA